jgi:hypothetical protein
MVINAIIFLDCSGTFHPDYTARGVRGLGGLI